MIFREDLAKAIVAGRKVETRRRRSTNPRSPWWEGGCAYDVGQIFAVQPGRGRPRIANARVLEVDRVLLGDIDDAAGRREGLRTAVGFVNEWIEIHGGFDPAEVVWVVRFEVVKAPREVERAARAEIVRVQG